MTFSEFVKMLYSYCGAGEEEAEFIVTLTSNIMKKSDDERNPLSDQRLDYRKRIYEGKRELSRKDVTTILNCVDKIQFEKYIDDLADDARQSISDSLNGYGIDSHLNNVGLYCADLLENILKAIVSDGEPKGVPLNNLPHKRNPYFTGREEKLKAIQDNFKNKDAVSLTQSVTGLGGIGKTSVALEYAYINFKKYETIWWVNAETEQTSLNAFRDFALNKKIIPDDAKAAEIIEAMKNWFNNTNNKRWIFIYDNADADNFNEWFEKYLPQTDNGHVLITTRSCFFPKSTTINIDIFNYDEALSFLKKRTRKKGKGYSDDAAKELAECLQYLPLALEQASAYIEQTPGVTYQDYIKLFEKYGTEIFKKKIYLVDYTSTIAITWKISMDKITDGSAVQMFNMCAYFAPDKIPVDIFVRGHEVLTEPLRNDISDDLRRNDIIRDLTRYSLLSCENDDGILTDENRVLYMHRLLQEVVQKSHGDNTVWLRYCLDFVTKVIEHWEAEDKNSVELFKIESSHVIAVSEKSKPVFINSEEDVMNIACIFNIIGSGYYSKLGKYDSALTYYFKTLKSLETICEENHAEIAASYNNIGAVYSDIGEYSNALKYFAKALKIFENVHGENYSDIAKAYNNIGLLHSKLGEYDKALEYNKKSLKIRESIYGENHPDTATSYNNMGLIYFDLGKHDKALDYYEKSLKIRETIYGESHIEITNSYSNIAMFYSDLGEYDKALDYYEKSLKIRESIYGENHPDTASAYNSMGMFYYATGKLENALEYCKKASKIYEVVCGENHPDTTSSYNNIGSVYSILGEYDKALKYYKKVLKIREIIYGENHFATATIYNNLGFVYSHLNDHDGALKYYKKSLIIRETIYGENHLETATLYNNIGLLYSNLNECHNALEHLNKALIIRETIYGKNHPDIATSYNNIGYVYSILEDYDNALKYYQKALKTHKIISGDTRPDIANPYNNIGLVYSELGEYDKALKYYKKALKILKKFHPINHPNIYKACYNIKCLEEKIALK